MSKAFQLEITNDLLDAIRTAYQDFKTHGYINDESTSLGSTIFENETDFLYKEFCKLGYDGNEFICYGHYYPNHGAVYWICDSRFMSYEESRKLTDMLIEKNI
ncbi:hypothetical protein [Acinetobacter boissieri]|uniref:Uncharacterized protein n=1 Tax=Acinetobacter boissieri TaxID=1219383 RepID=A0A1G6JQU9_9GAMM|nr:hypothetical protein [Acinetobacter boissieri]SDC20356.1 hypothetical protein SAMN05421733_1126 [Acinetobacter boissieri]